MTPDLTPMMAEPMLMRRRPRILFVDDQRDVALSLSKLLSPLRAEIRFAEDGQAGLQRMLDEVFDLALIDLAMPPNGSGGLWLLRQLAAHRINTSTVVLSGQEGQQDTIEAQRVGAADYVVKHKARDELLDVTTEVLREAAESNWRTATTRLPAPVAVPLIQSRLQSDEVHRLRDSLHCVESVFRFTALASCASRRDLLGRRLAKPPSMGDWHSLCQELSRQAVEPPLDSWLAAVADPTAGRLASVRNELAHGAGPSRAWAVDQQHHVVDWLALFFTVAAARPAPRTVVAGKLEHTGESFDVDVADLAGEATAVPWTSLNVADPLRKGHVYLIADAQPPIDLWPLVLGASGGRPGQWTVSVLDSVRRNGHLRHLDLSSGERVDLELTAADCGFTRL